MAAAQDVDYLRSVLRTVCNGEPDKAVAGLLVALNEAGFYIVGEEEFRELHSAWSKLPSLQARLEKLGVDTNDDGGTGVVVKRGVH